MRIARLIAFAAATLFAASAAAAASEKEANAAFIEYPKESLANGEQGIVSYRVKIDSRGRARKCEVIGSSGHHRLDLATCQLLMDNAEFTPRRDGGGRAIGSSFEGRVHWRIG